MSGIAEQELFGRSSLRVSFCRCRGSRGESERASGPADCEQDVVLRGKGNKGARRVLPLRSVAVYCRIVRGDLPKLFLERSLICMVRAGSYHLLAEWLPVSTGCSRQTVIQE